MAIIRKKNIAHTVLVIVQGVWGGCSGMRSSPLKSCWHALAQRAHAHARARAELSKPLQPTSAVGGRSPRIGRLPKLVVFPVDVPLQPGKGTINTTPRVSLRKNSRQAGKADAFYLAMLGSTGSAQWQRYSFQTGGSFLEPCPRLLRQLRLPGARKQDSRTASPWVDVKPPTPRIFPKVGR